MSWGPTIIWLIVSQQADDHARFVGFTAPATQSGMPESAVVAHDDPAGPPPSALGEGPESPPGSTPGAALGSPSGDIAARVAAIDAAATAYVRAARPAHTGRAYAGDWALWTRYTAGLGVPALTCSPGLLAGFALWLEAGHHDAHGRAAAPATVRRRLYGAVTALREHGVTVPAGASAQATHTVNAYARRLAEQGTRRGRGPAPAVSVKQLRAICAELPPTLAGHRDRAILLLGFSLAARRDELAHLTVDDLTDDPHGLLVTVRAAKTGPRTVAVPYGTRAATCPVTAWHTWAGAADLSDGRAFRAIDRHGNLATSITGQAIGTAITRAADQAGLLVHVTAHSLRAGLATEARRAGHDPLTIARQGGWVDGSPVLYGYIRTIDRWTDNALDNIGL